MAQIVKNPTMQKTWGSTPGWGRSPGGGNGYPLVFLPGKPYGQRRLVVYNPWGHKDSDTAG